MAINLIDTVRNFITPELVDRASSHLGESREGIDKAVAAGVPALFAGYVHRAEHGDAPALLTEAKEAATHDLAQTSGTLFTGGVSDQPTGAGWGTSLVGGNFSALTGAIASHAGIKPGSATSLMTLLAPLTMGTLGQYALDNNWDAPGLASFLSGQKSSIMSAVPQGLHIDRLLGAKQHQAAAVPQGHAHQAGHDMARKQPKTNWLWILLLLLAIAAVLVYLYTRNGDDASPGVAPGTSDTTAYRVGGVNLPMS
jgi:hypothetical protein